jgi:hypothetical protein
VDLVVPAEAVTVETELLDSLELLILAVAVAVQTLALVLLVATADQAS